MNKVKEILFRLTNREKYIIEQTNNSIQPDDPSQDEVSQEPVHIPGEEDE